MKTVELLAPAGNRAKLNTALRFGADAVYIGGSSYGLRAYADNFDETGLKAAVSYAHSLKKKVYVTVNIFASNRDFAPLAEYLQMLQAAGADAVIVTDAGVIDLCKKVAEKLDIHLSTQANTTNGYAARFWAQQGVKRIVLSRELPLSDIIEIRNIVGNDVELEVFVHGAMCISYSGRCLLSSYLTSRDSNRGECVQACRWEYAIAETQRRDNPLTLTEDAHGSYILNSKDLNMLSYVGELISAGVDCFKIEGRMKSEYYVASVVNAYRRAIDGYGKYGNDNPETLTLLAELDKVSHRGYTTGLYFENKDNVCYETSKADGDYIFAAEVLGYDEVRGAAIVEQRNRFKAGDELEVLSPDGNF
jgi:Collagenase and related proteases